MVDMTTTDRRVIVDGVVDTMATVHANHIGVLFATMSLTRDSHLLICWVLQQPVWKMKCVVVCIILVGVLEDCIIPRWIGERFVVELEEEESAIVIRKIDVSDLAWMESCGGVTMPSPILHLHMKALQ